MVRLYILRLVNDQEPTYLVSATLRGISELWTEAMGESIEAEVFVAEIGSTERIATIPTFFEVRDDHYYLSSACDYAKAKKAGPVPDELYCCGGCEVFLDTDKLCPRCGEHCIPLL